jgi:nucleoside-diphosphate-sugar epimerase
MQRKPVAAVTGANGYVGGVIAKALQPAAEVVRLVRSPRDANDKAWSFDTQAAATAEILRSAGVTCLIHAAWDMTASSYDELDRICVQGSARLFEAARAAGIDNVVFISTISAFDGARSAYGRSKLRVEELCGRYGFLVFRLGLVCGKGNGGVFGNMRRIAKSALVIPMIGNGKSPQYLLPAQTLGDVMRRAVTGDLPRCRGPVTLADREPVPFRDLLRILAGPARRPFLLPIPWFLLYAGLRLAESLKLKLKFRSDSVISFVFQNKSPDFEPMRKLGIVTKPMELLDDDTLE